MEKTRHIVILAPDNTSLLDVAGPLEVFAKAKDYIASNIPTIKESYTTHVLSLDSSKVVNTISGLPIICEGDYKSIYYEVDTLLLGGAGAHGSKGKKVPDRF